MKLFLNENEYSQYMYTSEEEFEKDIVLNYKRLFGEKTIYLDFKKRLKGKYNNDTIPDGYLLDYTFADKPKLYFIENELIRHGIKDHIVPQLLKFQLNFKSNMMTLKNSIIEKMVELRFKPDEIANKYNYRNADDMFTEIILKDELNIIVPIDEVTEELKECVSVLKINIELIEFKKFKSKDSVIFMFDPFTEEVENTAKSLKVASEDIDTIIVPAEKEGFEKEFIKNNRWFAISIGINMLDKLKYIVSYQKTPIGALTYYAEIAKIEQYEDTGKYIIYFKDKAKKLPCQIPLNKDNPNKAPQQRVYSNFNKIYYANAKTTMDDIY